MNLNKSMLVIYLSMKSMWALASHEPSKITETDIYPNKDYSYAIVANLDFEPSRSQESKLILQGQLTYPQGFYVDSKTNQLFVLRYTLKKPNIPLIDIYAWPDFSYKKTVFLDTNNGYISEGLYFSHINNESFIYTRGRNNLLKFPLSNETRDGTTLSGNPVINSNVAQSFSFFDNKFYVEYIDSRQARGNQSRGNYSIYDADFNHKGFISFDPEYTGTKKSQQNNSSKHQGFSAYSEGFVMSMGGYWKPGMPVTPYAYQGLNFFDSKGNLVSSQYIKPDAMLSILNSRDLIADRIENEGVQVLDSGSILTLNVIQVSNKRTGGLLFLEVDRKSMDRKKPVLNFSPAAVN